MLYIALGCVLTSATVAKASTDDLIIAIAHVESNANPNAPDSDNGEAIGEYSIHHSCWQDAVNFDTTIGGSYEDCHNAEYARLIVVAYLKRYAPQAWTDCNYESLSRTWNGGPNGCHKKATLKYWRKVKAYLDQHNGT